MTSEMFCCKRKQSCQSSIYVRSENSENEKEDEEDLFGSSGFNQLEIKEWKMELRENNICMDEHNLLIKKQKIKAIEENTERQRKASEQEMDEKEKELEIQRKHLDKEMKIVEGNLARKKGIEEKDQAQKLSQELVDKHNFELTEKNALLEITLKMKKNEKKMEVEFRTNNGEQQDGELLRARSIEVEERERELVQQQESLDERELQLEEKKLILEIAFRVNDFR
jgi:hypothetical protein